MPASMGCVSWQNLAWVAAGSALGGVARYAISIAMMRVAWPLGTFTVNVVGCFFIGVFVFSNLFHAGLPLGVRLFATVGLLGGFTTMSTFSLEAMTLLQARQTLAAAAYIGGTLVACLASTFLGSMAAVAIDRTVS